MNDKVLVIGGVTATGKTALALELATKYGGELISADSRQIYKEMNVITGKDIPTSSEQIPSDILWRDKKLGYYLVEKNKVWLVDMVYPNEEFNVSFWNECAILVIADILSRGKLPIVVGGTGLYIQSLLKDLSNISVPYDKKLRSKAEKMNLDELFDYLNTVDKKRAENLNNSDRHNPRRLIRAIEIASYKSEENKSTSSKFNFLMVGLTAPLPMLKELIDKRVEQRKTNGAREEYDLITQKYDRNLPSMTAAGYSDWDNWSLRELQYAKRQLTWFKKMPGIIWYDVSEDTWRFEAEKLIAEWYNK